MHQAQAAVQIGPSVPGGEAVAHAVDCGIARFCSAPLEQVRQQHIRQIDLIVHDHLLQVGSVELAGLFQAGQGKPRTRAERQAIATDQRRKAGQRLRRIGQPSAVVGMLHKIATAQLRLHLRREDTRLGRTRIDLPVAFAARAVENDHFQPRRGVAATRQQFSIDVRHYGLVEVEGLPGSVGGQGVDPGNALQALHRGLQRGQAVRLVERMPLLQHPGVGEVGILQAERHLAVPVQPPRPFHQRAEAAAEQLAGHRAGLTVRALDHHTQLFPFEGQ